MECAAGAGRGLSWFPLIQDGFEHPPVDYSGLHVTRAEGNVHLVLGSGPV